jgi:3-oxoadipate enol-lactonase
MHQKLFHSVQGQGAPLVLLHPVGIDHSFWGPLIDAASSLHTVIAVDLMGHGSSPPAPAGRAIGAYAADVAALLDELNMPRASLLGLSFGGMIAQEFAVTYPGRVSSLVVGACGPRIPPEARGAVRARGKVDPATGMASVVDQTMLRWFTPPFMSAEPAQRVRARLLADDPAGWAAGWNAIADFDALDRLGTVAAPTLVIAGELDAGAAVATTKMIADAILGSRFEVLSGAPHMMHIECADRFTDRVMAFLRATRTQTQTR